MPFHERDEEAPRASPVAAAGSRNPKRENTRCRFPPSQSSKDGSGRVAFGKFLEVLTHRVDRRLIADLQSVTRFQTLESSR